MTRVELEPYWKNVKQEFMKSRDQWLMETENLSNEMAVWLAQVHGCMIRGRKHLFFQFEDERDAELFVLKFSGKD